MRQTEAVEVIILIVTPDMRLISHAKRTVHMKNRFMRPILINNKAGKHEPN